MFLLGAITRFAIVSPAKTKASKSRLRRPEPEGIESMEFYLVDRSRQPPATWPIGAFSPLTKADVREKMKISRVTGIPIADDLDKGMYLPFGYWSRDVALPECHWP